MLRPRVKNGSNPFESSTTQLVRGLHQAAAGAHRTGKPGAPGLPLLSPHGDQPLPAPIRQETARRAPVSEVPVPARHRRSAKLGTGAFNPWRCHAGAFRDGTGAVARSGDQGSEQPL